MGIWYRNGTVSLNNNSAAVAGVGTAFVANVQPGDGLYVGGDLYEIASIAGNTQLTLERPYQGANLSNVGYAIMPTRGVTKQAADAMFGLIGAVEGFRDGPLVGRFAKGTLAAPSLRSPTDGNTGINFADIDRIELITNAIRRVLLTTTTMQVDVPITGLAVQNSLIDSTPGKLALVGAFGGGGAISTAEVVPFNNANSCRVSGVWRFDSNTVGAPSAAGFLQHFIRLSGDEATRHFQVATTHLNERFTRSMTGTNTWGPWYRIFDQSCILGTVSQASGVPTGAVIERGSNANGEYTRWADGTQVCWYSAAVGGVTVSTGGLYTTSTDQTWTFPAAFSAQPTFAGSGRNTGQIVGVSCTGNLNTVSAIWRPWAAVASAGSYSNHLLAIGRWF